MEQDARRMHFRSISNFARRLEKMEAPTDQTWKRRKKPGNEEEEKQKKKVTMLLSVWESNPGQGRTVPVVFTQEVDKPVTSPHAYHYTNRD